MLSLILSGLQQPLGHFVFLTKERKQSITTPDASAYHSVHLYKLASPNNDLQKRITAFQTLKKKTLIGIEKQSKKKV